MSKPYVKVQDLGHIIYQEAWDLQKELVADAIAVKRANRNLPEGQQQEQNHFFLFCEHPHVYTLGRSGAIENLLLNNQELQNKGVEFFKINRGGDITYHGPGQVVGYPIFDLDHFFTDIHKYVRFIEEAVIRTLAEYDINGDRIKGLSGVWLKADEKGPDRKICALGIHLSRWVTQHGFALNANTDLDFFDYIVPCGIKNKAVTSMAQELGHEVDLTEVKRKLIYHFQALFNFNIIAQEI
ncbi:MAG: lipoyl(octanoyl) transferase LipB [Bacteroidota bacterium]